MEFHEVVTILAPPQRVWDFLWDIEQMITCIPGCETAQVVEIGKRYKAVVGQKVGPFTLKLPLEIVIKEREAPQHLVVVASGRDNRVSTNVTIELELHLTDRGSEGTEMTFTTRMNILGKLAILGHGLIQRKAKEVIAQFARTIKQHLEEGERLAAV